MTTTKFVSIIAAGLLFASPVLAANDTWECYKASCDFEVSEEAGRPAQAAAPSYDFYQQLALWIEALHANCNHPGQGFDKELARQLEALGANCDHPGPEFLARLAALLESGR